jgi:hypothetical protein
MNISHQQVEALILVMIKMSKEVDDYRSLSNHKEDDEYVGYREGYYDACLDILTNLGYSVSEINEMEEVLAARK